MKNLMTVEQLYPTPTPEDAKAALSAWSGERDIERRAILRRPLTGAERDALRRRAHSLEKWIQKAGDGEVEALILTMSLGLATKGETDREAALRVSHYAEILASQPLWAIKRACDRFERGEVTPQEVGETRPFATGMVPATSHLYRVTSAISRPIFHERITINEVLNGTYKPSKDDPAARAAADASIAKWRAQKGVVADSDLAARRERENERVRDEEEKRHELVLREYRAQGIEPPAPKNGVVPALATLLALGCRVIDGPRGTRVVELPPNPFAPPPPDTRAEIQHDRDMAAMKTVAKTVVEGAKRTAKERQGAAFGRK